MEINTSGPETRTYPCGCQTHQVYRELSDKLELRLMLPAGKEHETIVIVAHSDGSMGLRIHYKEWTDMNAAYMRALPPAVARAIAGLLVEAADYAELAAERIRKGER